MKVGEIYWVKLDPAIGSEAQKRRPCLLVTEVHNHTNMVICIPLLKWKKHHFKTPVFVQLNPDQDNGLDELRTPDPFQMRAVDSSKRIDKKLGRLKPEIHSEVVDAITLIFKKGI